MIYVIFLCFSFAGRPELDNCEAQTRVIHQTAAECADEMQYLRTWWKGRDGLHSLEGDGQYKSGLKWHREFRCMARPTWNPVD